MKFKSQRLPALLLLILGSLLGTVVLMGSLKAAAAPAADPLVAAADQNSFIPLPDWFAFQSSGTSKMGQAIAIGDIDGDESPDLIVGSPGFNNGRGKVDVYLSASGAIPSTPDKTLVGAQANSEFGYALAIGYFNNDSFADLAVGAPGLTGGGAVFIFQGTNNGGGLIEPPFQTLTSPNPMPSSRFGHSLVKLYDMNTADSFFDDELAVGAPNYNTKGQVNLFISSGAGLVFDTTFNPNTTQTNIAFGHALAVADANSDSYQDLIIGSPEYKDAFPSEGAAFVYHATGLTTTLMFTSPSDVYVGGAAGGRFGYALLGGWDFDGDGYEEIAIGAPDYPVDGQAKGLVYIVNSNQSGNQVIYGHTPGERFGAALAAGDFDYNFQRTSHPALAVGAPGYFYGLAQNKAGAVYLHFSDGTKVLDVFNFRLTGKAGNSNFGTSLAMGFIDSNSGAAVLAGAPGFNANAGGAFLFKGRIGDVSPFASFSNDSPTRLGTAVNFNASLISGTNVMFDWDFGDGSPIATTYVPSNAAASTTSHIYTSPGTYIPKVTAFAPGTKTGYVISDVVVVDEPIAGLILRSNSPTRLGRTTTFTVGATSGTNVSYTVYFKDGSIGTNVLSNAKGLFNFNHRYTTSRAYNVLIVAENSVSVMTATTRVRVVDPQRLSSGGGSFTEVFSNGAQLNFSAPQGSVDGEADLLFNIDDEPGFDNPPRGLLGLYFDLELVKAENAADARQGSLGVRCVYLPLVNGGGGSANGSGTNVLPNCTSESNPEFLKPVTLTVTIPDSVLQAKGVSSVQQLGLKFYYYDEVEGKWKDGATTCSPTSKYSYPDKNTIQLPICHQSRWSM